LFRSQRAQTFGCPRTHAIPAIYALREYAFPGGLMSYGASIDNIYRQAGLYVGKVLNGETVADLPVMCSTHCH
jgi:ABC-type uncharacterized transport system substrate-binding protein